MKKIKPIYLISLDTHQDLHIIPANKLASEILYRKGNLYYKNRFRKVKENSIKWTSLVGGSFSNHVFDKKDNLLPKSKTFTFGFSFSNYHHNKIVPIRTLETQIFTTSMSASIYDQNKEEEGWYVLVIFPVQWDDIKEMKTVISNIASQKKKKQPMGIISMGADIDSTKTINTPEYRWAHFQAQCHSIAYPLGLRLRFKRVKLDPDEICDAIESIWQ